MIGTDLYVNKPHCAAAVRPWESEVTTSTLRRHSSPYCCWSLWWISADGTFSPTRNLITMRFSTLRGTFCSLITLATLRQDWTGSNTSRREGGGCGFTLSRSHSCCAVRLVYIQISPGHIWSTLYYTPTGSVETWDSSVGVAPRLYTGRHRNDFRQCQEIFILSESQAQI